MYIYIHFNLILPKYIQSNLTDNKCQSRVQFVGKLFVWRLITETGLHVFTRIPWVVPWSAEWKNLPNKILIGEPNKCIINVRNPKLMNIHKRIIFKVIAFIPPQKASPKTPQPAMRTIHVLSNAIFVYHSQGVWGESRFSVLVLGVQSSTILTWRFFVELREKGCWEIRFYKPRDA